MIKETLIELSRCSLRVNRPEETEVSWSNNSLLARIQQGIHVFDYSHNLRCTDKEIDCYRYCIPVSKNSPATKLFKSSFFKRGLRNSEMTEMIVNPALWPHNSQIMEESTTISSCEWAPPDFVVSSEHVLAVLNCVGNVDIYAQNINKWSHLDLSTLVCGEFTECFNVDNNFEEICKAAYSLETCVICWAPELNDDKSCYFVTAQKNGNILLWNLIAAGMDIQGQYLGKFESNLGEIVKMVWIRKSNNNFILICSEITGPLVAFECNILNNMINLLETYKIWTHHDKMVVKYIHYEMLDEKLILFFNKHRHLVVQMIDKSWRIISTFIKNVNDFRITSLKNSSYGLLMSTVNCKLYNIKVEIINVSLSIDITPIEIKDISSSMELYSISLSKNNVMCTLGVADRKMTFKKDPYSLEVVFTAFASKLNDIMSLILNNPSRKLTYYWDCVEVLRYNIFKAKKMPDLNYEQLYMDAKTDVYKLKIYLILLIMHTELGRLKYYNLTLPEKSEEYVRELILVFHAVDLISKLVQSNDGVWEEFELDSVVGAKNYLDVFCHKHKKNISDYINIDLFNDMKSSTEYICQSCDEKMEGFACKMGHQNMLCSLTFTPITGEDYLFCKACGVTARTEMILQEPLCVFCDSRLYKYS